MYNFNGGSTVIRKVNSDNTLTWMARFTVGPIIRSLSISPNEQNLFFGSYTSQLLVFVINANTGAFISTQK